jgi:hypothetical protein
MVDEMQLLPSRLRNEFLPAPNVGLRRWNSVPLQLLRQATPAQTSLRRIFWDWQHMWKIGAPAARLLRTGHRRIALRAESLHAVIIQRQPRAFNVS